MDQRGRRCLGLERGKRLPAPTSAPTGARRGQVQSFQALKPKTGTRAEAAAAEGSAHNAFKNAGLQPVGVNVRHICWTWYCSDRLRMERWSREYNTFETNKEKKKKKTAEVPLGKKKKNQKRNRAWQISVPFKRNCLNLPKPNARRSHHQRER